MKPERWRLINDLFQSAAECPPEKRDAFLDEACGNDEALRRELKSLITSHDRTEKFIESPAFEVAPELLTNDRADALVGELIGHYRIKSFIGSGGMGEVYLAGDVTAGRNAALKLLPMRFTGDTERLKRFQQEARAVVALNHPNIVTVYEIGEHHSIPYIASELIEGVTLRHRMMSAPLEIRDAVDLVSQVASALAAAHAAGIVHRDIKPENIMLRPDGYVKVLDFGIAKLAESALGPSRTDSKVTDGPESVTLCATNPGAVLGTFRYMSPEQARGASIGPESDIWSLGAVLYEIVTGHDAFPGGTTTEITESILEKEPVPLTHYIEQAPVELQQIITKALCKDSMQRYHSAGEMLQALNGLRRRLDLKDELEREMPSWVRWARSPTVLALIAVAVVIAIAAPFVKHRNLATGLPPEKSIAVLPFENLSEDKSSAYFADGIQDEILTRLSKIADLKVISRSSTQRYRNKSQRLPEIAHQLGVANLLEGSVQKTNDQVRVNVQLIKAANDSHLWAETFDRTLTDIFSVETDIAKTIAETLQAKLTGSEEHAISVKPTADTAAYQSYLKARYFWGRRSGDNVAKAIDYFKEAIAQDPNYGLAYAGLAEAWIALPGYAPVKTQDVKPKAKEAALRSLEIDDTLAQAHNALGQILFFDLDFGGAIKEFQRAIALDPNYATAHQWYAVGALQALGKFDEAIAEGARAVELDPLSPIINMDQANNYIIAGRYDDAINQINKALELDPQFGAAHYNLGLALELKGDVSGAIAEFKRACQLNDDPLSLAYLGNLYGKTGNITEATRTLAELEQLTKTKYVSAYAFALVQLGLGSKAEALRSLEKCYADRCEDIVYIKVDPLLDPLRDDPGFQNLVVRVFSGKDE